jgi:uncharacterized lipoprotein YmbA
MKIILATVAALLLAGCGSHGTEATYVPQPSDGKVYHADVQFTFTNDQDRLAFLRSLDAAAYGGRQGRTTVDSGVPAAK